MAIGWGVRHPRKRRLGVVITDPIYHEKRPPSAPDPGASRQRINSGPEWISEAGVRQVAVHEFLSVEKLRRGGRRGESVIVGGGRAETVRVRWPGPR